MHLTRCLLLLCLLWLCLLGALPAVATASETASPGEAAEAGSALPTVPGYTEVQRLASPHATQAAAADATRLYAISNTTVATYDRTTGKLLATASAEGTEHLNSGFLHDGKLYAAHSNYPELPHESDIRVFDPDPARAMALVDALSTGATPIRAAAGIAEATAGADGIVNASPIGMYRYPGNPVPATALGRPHWVFDAVYTPIET